MAHSGFAELPRAHATTVPNNINTMRNKCQLHACRTHGIAWPWLPIWMIHLYHLLPASDLKLCQPRSKAGPTSALALTSKDIVAFLSSLCSLLVAQCLRLENIKSMTASQQIRCTRYTKWIQMDNEWTWKMKLGSSMISKLKMLKMLKQLSTLIPGLAPQNSPSWSGDHLVVNQKLKQLPQSGHRRAQGCYRLLSQVTVSNARPAKTSTYINHAFHNMVIDHRSLYKFVLLHQIPSLHPSFGANPYRMDFGRLSVATVISVCHRISIKLVQTTDPGSSRATRLPTRSIQYLYAQKARFAHTTFEGLQRILTQGNLKDGLKEFLGNHQIPPQFNFICKGIFKEFRGYALGLMRLLMMMMMMMMMTRYDIILIML